MTPARYATARYATVATPPGPFTVLVTEDDDGADVVLGSGWTEDVEGMLALIHPTLRPATAERVDRLPVLDVVTAFHEGDVTAIDSVRVHQRSGPFREAAWEAMRTIPAGRPETYTEFAARCGRPTAVRAAASACSKNAVALFVPCHRVHSVGGALGGFRWKVLVKGWLRDHEAAHAPASVAG